MILSRASLSASASLGSMGAEGVEWLQYGQINREKAMEVASVDRSSADKRDVYRLMFALVNQPSNKYFDL